MIAGSHVKARIGSTQIDINLAEGSREAWIAFARKLTIGHLLTKGRILARIGVLAALFYLAPLSSVIHRTLTIENARIGNTSGIIQTRIRLARIALVLAIGSTEALLAFTRKIANTSIFTNA